MSGAKVTRYTSISASRIRDMLSPPTAAVRQPRKPGAILVLDLAQAVLADLALGHEYEVQPEDRFALVPTEAFAEKSLRAVPLDGAADPPAGRQPHARDLQPVFNRQQGEEGTVQPKALPEGSPEVPGPLNPLPRPKPGVGDARRPRRYAATRFRPF
jgi:hypothetical protein